MQKPDFMYLKNLTVPIVLFGYLLRLSECGLRDD